MFTDFVDRRALVPPRPQTAMHAATWAGVPGFTFEAEGGDGACSFHFCFDE